MTEKIEFINKLEYDNWKKNKCTKVLLEKINKYIKVIENSVIDYTLKTGIQLDIKYIYEHRGETFSLNLCKNIIENTLLEEIENFDKEK
jgi:hypothetical protein